MRLSRLVCNGAVAALVLLGALDPSLHANVVFSDLGPGNTYGVADYSITGSLSFGNVPAFAFTAGATTR